MASVRRNFIYSVAYQLLTYLTPLLTTPYLSRVLGPDGIGEYSLGNNLAQYFALLALLGVGRSGTRSIAAVRDDREKTERLFWELYAMQLCTVALAVMAYLGVVIVWYQGAMGWIWLPFLVAEAFDITWLFYGEEDFRVTVLRSSIVKILTVVGIFVFVKQPTDVWLYAAITSFGQLASLVSILPFARKYISRFVRPSLGAVLTHVKPNLILFIPQVATNLYRSFDKVILGALSTSQQLGLFDSAEKIILVPLGIVGALGSVMLPRMAHVLARGDNDSALRMIRSTMDFSLAFAVGLAAGVAGVSADFSVAFFGPAFEGCAGLMTGLAFTVPFIACATVVREQYLIPAKRDKDYVRAVIVGGICNLVLNLMLVSSFGAWGSCAATMVTEVLVCVMLCIPVFSELKIGRCFVDCIPFVVLSLAMLVAIRLTSGLFEGNELFATCAEFGVGVAVYLCGGFIICRTSSRLRQPLLTMLPGRLHWIIGGGSHPAGSD